MKMKWMLSILIRIGLSFLILAIGTLLTLRMDETAGWTWPTTSDTTNYEAQQYALTNEGLFVLENHLWREIETIPEVPLTLAVAPSTPDILYAGCPSMGLYCSLDGGQTWEHRNDGLNMVPGVALRITAIAVDERDAAHVVVATAYGLGRKLAGSTIYESGDGGARWHKLGEVDSLVNELIIDGRLVWVVTVEGLTSYDSVIGSVSTNDLDL